MTNLFYIVVIVRSAQKMSVRILKHGWVYMDNALNMTCLFARNLQIFLAARGFSAQNVAAFCTSKFLADIGYVSVVDSKKSIEWNPTSVNNWRFCSNNGYGFVYVDVEHADENAAVKYSIGDSNRFGILEYFAENEQDMQCDRNTWLRCRPSKKESISNDSLKRLLPNFWNRAYYEKHFKRAQCI